MCDNFVNNIIVSNCCDYRIFNFNENEIINKKIDFHQNND